MTATPSNSAKLAARMAGVETALQEEPSQRSTSGWLATFITPESPTAQAECVLGTAATLLRRSKVVEGLALETAIQGPQPVPTPPGIWGLAKLEAAWPGSWLRVAEST